MSENPKPDPDFVLIDGDVNDSLLAITKGTIDMIFNNAEVDSINPDPKTGKKSKIPIQGDMMALYTFYAYTAKWQETHKIRCTTGFAVKGMGWTEARVLRAKKALMRIGLVFDDYGWVEVDGKRVKRSYIRFRYYMPRKGPPHIRGGSNMGPPYIGDKCFRDNSSNASEIISTPSNSQREDDTETLDKPAGKAEDPKAEPQKTQKLNPLQERIIRAAQSVGRVSATARALSPNRDRSEATAWKRLRPLVTEEDVALIEKFYAAPKSEDMDETWHRKQSATALMNQWTSQVEFSQLWMEKQKPTSTTEEFPSWDYEHFCKLVPEFEGIPAKDYPEHWRKGLQYVLEEAQDLYRERIKWTA